MDKVLNLMNMINEVDDMTNVADLKNKLEKHKILKLKAIAEREELQNQILKLKQDETYLRQELKEENKEYQKKLQESQNIIANLNMSINS